MREALPAKLKLEVTLRYLATGDSFKSLAYLYRLSKSSISNFLPEVFDAIFDGLKEFIQVNKYNKNIKTYNIRRFYFYTL